MLHIAVVVDLLFTLDDCLNINKSPVNFVTFSISDFSDSEISHIFFLFGVVFLIYSPLRASEQTDDHCETGKNRRKRFFYSLHYFSLLLWEAYVFVAYRIFSWHIDWLTVTVWQTAMRRTTAMPLIRAHTGTMLWTSFRPCCLPCIF